MAHVGVRGRGTTDRVVGEITGAGAAVGVIGGTVMAAFLMLFSLGAGLGFWFPLAAIGSTFYSAAALDGGAAPMIAGIVMHLATSAFWGIVFSLIVQRSTGWATSLAAGIGFGLGVLLFMTFLVLPWANPLMYERLARDMPGTWIVAHALFGATLALVPAFRRRMAGQPAIREASEPNL